MRDAPAGASARLAGPISRPGESSSGSRCWARALPPPNRGGRPRARAAWRAVDRGGGASPQLDRSIPCAGCAAAAAARVFPRAGGRSERSLVEAGGDRAGRRDGAGIGRGRETALGILRDGDRVGIFPEGWVAGPAADVQPPRRGVAFLSEHATCRVPPVGLSGTIDLWRGAALRIHVSTPLPALDRSANRGREAVYLDRLRDALQRAIPAQPSPPATGRRPWCWLDRAL